MRRDQVELAARRIRGLCQMRLTRLGPSKPFTFTGCLSDYNPMEEERLGLRESIRQLELVIEGCGVASTEGGYLREDLTTAALDRRLEVVAGYIRA